MLWTYAISVDDTIAFQKKRCSLRDLNFGGISFSRSIILIPSSFSIKRIKYSWWSTRRRQLLANIGIISGCLEGILQKTISTSSTFLVRQFDRRICIHNHNQGRNNSPWPCHVAFVRFRCMVVESPLDILPLPCL